MLSVWIVGGFIAICGALTFAKIATQFPHAGGFYVFLKEAFGDLPAFLYGWSMLLVINTGSLAALSLVFTSYLSSFIPLSENMQLFVAIVAIALLTIMNVLGVKFGSLFATIFTSAKLTGILIVVIIGIFFGINQNVDFINTNFSENKNNLSSAIAKYILGAVRI